MKRKTRFRLLACLLALSLLVGIMVVNVGAESPTVTFVNPLGEVVPPSNQPLADRLVDLNGATIRLLQHGGPNSASVHTMESLRIALNAVGVIAPAVDTFGGTSFDARPSGLYDEWVNNVDAIIIGVLEDNVAAWWVGYHAREIEARGTPVVVLTTEWFYSSVRTGAQDNGFAAMRVVTIPNSPWADAQGHGTPAGPGGNPPADFTARRAYIDANIVGGAINIGAAVTAALTDPLTLAEQSSDPLTVAAMGLSVLADGRSTHTVPGADAIEAMPAFQNLSMELGFGDGLPLVVPTQAAVDAMIATVDRNADEVLGRVMLRGGIMTVENVAANAVMAGARPEHFPVILAAMEAYVNGWEDDKLFYRSVMSNDQRTLALVVSGPIVGSGAGQLDIARGRTLGQGSNDSDVIGRAVMLAIRNIGHIAHENSHAMGGISRITSHRIEVKGEANEFMPAGWETLSEHMGFGAGSNTVTLIAVTSARWTGGVGGTAAGGTGGAFDSFAAHRTNATPGSGGRNDAPAIHLVHANDAHQIGSTDTRSVFDGGLAHAARGINSKAMLQQWIAGTGGTVATGGAAPGAAAPTIPPIVRNTAREALVWPAVAGIGHSTQGRVYHGGGPEYNNSRGFHTQRVGGVTAPSAPQGFVVTTPNPGEAVLTWTAPIRGLVTGYEVSNDGGRTWISAGMATTYTFVNLSGGEYFFAVRARSAIQNSADVRSGAGYPTAVLDFARSSGRGAWAISHAVVATGAFDLLEATREALQDLIDEIEELVEEDFTEDSWAELQAALAAAKAVLESENAYLDALETAYNNLREAFDALEPAEEPEEPDDLDDPEELEEPDDTEDQEDAEDTEESEDAESADGID